MRHGWRRFKAKLKRPAPTGGATTGLVARTEAYLEAVIQEVNGRGRLYVEHLAPIIDEQAKRVILNPVAAEWFALLILRAPVAARAQQHMDTHHGVHTHQAQLFDLIDFNDTFVSTVLALSPGERQGFVAIAQGEIARFCKRVGAHMFSEEQFEAITRGLTGEIAVYLGAQSQGYGVALTSRSQDAMGVDMVITDPLTGESINIDCKTPSSYRYRLQDLVREGRMSATEADQADLDGYAHEVNGHGGEAVEVTLFRLDPNEVGDIRDFMFIQPELLGAQLREIFVKKL